LIAEGDEIARPGSLRRVDAPRAAVAPPTPCPTAPHCLPRDASVAALPAAARDHRVHGGVRRWRCAGTSVGGRVGYWHLGRADRATRHAHL